jgi:hypothetical protein
VFTVESFREVRALLNDHGVAVVQHGLGMPFMAARMYEMLTEAFEMPPHVVQTPEIPGLTFIVGPGVRQYLPAPQALRVTGHVEKARDDWPFFYLEGRKMPREYQVALIAMLIVSALSVLACSKGRMRSVNGHFFFLGAAFLLIETLSVTRFALLFGSTWVVNSVVFSAILLVVLLANLWMGRLPQVNVHLFYALLFGSVLLNYFFPTHVLLSAGLVTRLVVAMLLLGAPIFFAAFIFAQSFKETTTPELAFASNLLGAVVGGLAEYSTLVIGFRAQLLIALALYALSYVVLLLPSRKPTAATT